MAFAIRNTSLCSYHAEGRCTYGSKCAFAHSEAELVHAPSFTQTRLCPLFSQGACRDAMCRFAHGVEELRGTKGFLSKKICRGWQRGACRFGVLCRFAHGEEDLRQDPPQSAMVCSGGRLRGHSKSNNLIAQADAFEPSARRPPPAESALARTPLQPTAQAFLPRERVQEFIEPSFRGKSMLPHGPPLLPAAANLGLMGETGGGQEPPCLRPHCGVWSCEEGELCEACESYEARLLLPAYSKLCREHVHEPPQQARLEHAGEAVGLQGGREDCAKAHCANDASLSEASGCQTGSGSESTAGTWTDGWITDDEFQ